MASLEVPKMECIIAEANNSSGFQGLRKTQIKTFNVKTELSKCNAVETMLAANSLF